MKILLVDDIRDLSADAIARDFETGKLLLQAHRWEELILDHDLGCLSRGNGYQLITWALENGFAPPTVFIVTSSPVGRENIIRALEAHGYARDLSMSSTWRKAK